MQGRAMSRGTAKFWGPLTYLSSEPAPLPSWALELPTPLPGGGGHPRLELLPKTPGTDPGN